MGKIGDLWVRLGLKKDGFDKGIKDAGNALSGASGNTGLMGILKKVKLGAVGAFAAIAAAAVSLADSFAHMSQRFGDEWDKAMAGMKASWRTFVSAISSFDFSNFGQRLKTVWNNAREIAASKDIEFEVMNSIELQRSAMEKENNYLLVQARNQKLSQKERIAAAEQYLQNMKGLYDKEEQYRRSHAEVVKRAYLEEAGLANTPENQAYLMQYLTGMAENTDLTKALSAYRKKGLGGLSNEQQQLVRQVIKENGTIGVDALSSLAEFYYKETNDERTKELVDAITKANYAAGAFDAETRRIQGIANQSVSDADSDGRKSREEAERRSAQQILQRAEDSAKGELQILSEKFDAEKALLQKFGLDTEALYNELAKNIRETIDTKLSDFDLTVDLGLTDDIDMSQVDADIDSFIDTFLSDMERAQEIVDEFRDSVISGLSGAFQELTDQMFGLEEVNPGRVIQALLTPLADMAIREGEIVMAAGLGIEAVKKGLESLQGVAAIAAGAMLIAVGSAAKSGLAALANAGGRSTATTTYGGAGAGASNVQTIQTELTVYVTGRLSGNDILLSGKKTQSNNNR